MARRKGASTGDVAGFWRSDQISNAFRPGDPRSPSLKFVVLAQATPNIPARLLPTSGRLQTADPGSRIRVTERLRQQVIERYGRGDISALGVGEELGLSKAAVLRILKQAGVTVRAQGQRLP
jgi:hypothetical protein